MSAGSAKLLLASVVLLFAAAPLMDSSSELAALAGLLCGLLAVAGLTLVAWRQL